MTSTLVSLTTWKALTSATAGGRARCQAVSTNQVPASATPIPTRTEDQRSRHSRPGIAASQPLGHRLLRVLGHLDIVPALMLRLAAKPSAARGTMSAVTHPALRTDTEGQRLRLLHVHAHPDDESSKGAATTAKYVAEGVEVVVATCTGGERGSILNPAMDRPDILANIGEIRRQEMDRAREILGIRQVWLGFVDSGLPEGDPLPPLPDGASPASTSRWPRLRWSR